MSVNPAQVVQLNCPNCRAPVRAQVFTLIDAGQYPELKSLLISGQINLAVCQNCGNPVMISAPLIYHDPAKQLMLTFFPQQLNARPEEQERFIGDATNMIMRSLPQDAPRGYLIAPKRFLTMNSLIDAVLEADGISKETIAAQRERVELIGRLAEAYEQGDEALSSLVDTEREKLDYEFFATLSAFVEASAQAAGQESATLLATLRDRLLELTGMTDELAEMGALGHLEVEDDDYDLDEIVSRLVDAPEDQLEVLIGELRPAIEYSFFEQLTQRIDAAEQSGDTATAQSLTARRTLIRETVERMDHQAQELFEKSATILNDVLQSEDTEQALRAHSAQIDEAFLLVLDTHIAAAHRAGRSDMIQVLEQVRKQAMNIIQEDLSPEDRFINELLQAETPQAATRMLRQSAAMINPTFVKRLNELAEESDSAGRKPLAERLRQLAREAGAMLF